MNYNIETLSRAIRSLESSIYVFERGMTQSLPHINSKRIDVLCGGIKSLTNELSEIIKHAAELTQLAEKADEILGLADQVEQLTEVVGPNTTKEDEISEKNNVEILNDFYKSIFENEDITIKSGTINAWDVDITTSTSDLQLQETGTINPITGEEITDESKANYIKALSNIKTCLYEYYKILIWLERQNGLNVVNSINVFDCDVE